MQLRSGIAVAVAQVGGYSSNLIFGPEICTCCRCSHTKDRQRYELVVISLDIKWGSPLSLGMKDNFKLFYEIRYGDT